MIEVLVIPPSMATEQELVVEITEDICKRMCVHGGSHLSGNVSFAASTPRVANGIAIVPITATGVIVVNGNACKGCNTKVRHFSETFEVAFTATTTNTVTLTAGDVNIVRYDDVTCCHTNKAKMTTTLTVTIA